MTKESKLMSGRQVPFGNFHSTVIPGWYLHLEARQIFIFLHFTSSSSYHDHHAKCIATEVTMTWETSQANQPIPQSELAPPLSNPSLQDLQFKHIISSLTMLSQLEQCTSGPPTGAFVLGLEHLVLQAYWPSSQKPGLCETVPLWAWGKSVMTNRHRGWDLGLLIVLGTTQGVLDWGAWVCTLISIHLLISSCKT